MSDTTETSFRIPEIEYSIVKEIAVKSDQYSSSKGFFEEAVRTNVNPLQNLAAGGKNARTLIKLLDNVRGITAPIPEGIAEAHILDGDLSDIRPRIELPTKIDTVLTEMKLETGLSRSELIRRCILRHLNQLTLGSDVIDGWRRDEIQQTWEEISADMRRPKSQCYDTLQLRFVDELPTTRRAIEADPAGFYKFADEYADKFHRSDCYKQLLEKRSERPMKNAENVIEEYTDVNIAVEEATDSFLQGILDEVEQ